MKILIAVVLSGRQEFLDPGAAGFIWQDVCHIIFLSVKNPQFFRSRIRLFLSGENVFTIQTSGSDFPFDQILFLESKKSRQMKIKIFVIKFFKLLYSSPRQIFCLNKSILESDPAKL